MVARRSGEIPVLIFDLDGTILAVNSFPHWAAYVARGCFPHLGLGRRARIASAAIALLGLRKLGLCDHETLKRRLQHLWQSATLDDGGACELNFIGGLSRHVRPELKPILAAVAAGKVDAVLATAAAADYADALGRSLGFADVLATPRSRRPSEPSNRGEHKRDSVMTLLRARGWQDRPRAVFTDHADDLPLIRLCQTLYWFGTARDLAAIEAMLPELRVFAGLPRDDALAMPLPEAACG
ncbi:MAG TPA: haloacid dehalogenase-like hydrolase [Stellaceae bacterium]|jgi:phosphoserine phosphatase|nr:haloacid dehalogenase-like hydrolase [Stellaceae bacterium]